MTRLRCEKITGSGRRRDWKAGLYSPFLGSVGLGLTEHFSLSLSLWVAMDGHVLPQGCWKQGQMICSEQGINETHRK